jgi:hypothetical protein
MPSRALWKWWHSAGGALNEIESAHKSVGGSGRGRRHATKQINHGYLLLLFSHFQGFCRDLHSECVDFLATRITPSSIQTILREAWVSDRKLDKGNPNADNLQRDFSRLGFNFSSSILTIQLSKRLVSLNDWRNAIAHLDFNKPALKGKTTLRVAQVRSFRSLCNRLAEKMDKSTCQHIQSITGQKPWP